MSGAHEGRVWAADSQWGRPFWRSGQDILMLRAMRRSLSLFLSPPSLLSSPPTFGAHRGIAQVPLETFQAPSHTRPIPSTSSLDPRSLPPPLLPFLPPSLPLSLLHASASNGLQPVRTRPRRPYPVPGPASQCLGPPGAGAGRRAGGAGGTRFPPPRGSASGLVPSRAARCCHPHRSSYRREWVGRPGGGRASVRHSRVSAPAGAARAGHHAAGPEAHLQRMQDHVVLHVEEGHAGGDPLPSLHWPGRRRQRGRRLGGGWRDWGQQRRWRRLRRGDLRQHLRHTSAEQRGRGRQAGELLRPLPPAEADRALGGRGRVVWERAGPGFPARRGPAGWNAPPHLLLRSLV